MYYRALVLGIVLFWLWTTAALVRTQWAPGISLPTEVPTAYLWKLLFLHEESSDLVLYNGQQRLGSFHVQPRQTAGVGSSNTPSRRITAIGGFTVDLPGAARQNFVVHGLVEFGDGDKVQRLELSIVVHEPKQSVPAWTLVLDGQPTTGRWHYSVRQRDLLVREQTGTMAELLDLPELRSVGIDPVGIAKLQQEQLAHVTVTAHRDKLRINEDDVDTYAVVLKDANGLEATIYLSQLGQILAVKTFTSFELLDATLTP